MTKRILFVEDSDIIRMMMAKYFKNKDFEVIACSDLASALNAWDKYKGELSFVLADCHCPELEGGARLLRKVVGDAEKDSALNVPVALITSDQDFKWGERYKDLEDRDVPILYKLPQGLKVLSFVLDRAIEIVDAKPPNYKAGTQLSVGVDYV